MRTWTRWVGIAAVVAATIVPAPALGQSTAASGTVTVYFSPQDHPGDAVVRAFGAAHGQILAAIYEFTESRIADALLAAVNRHVAVWMIMDQSASRDRGSQSFRLAETLGAHARIRAGISGATGIVHDKFAVVDGARVLTGSFNWTYAAEDRNWENLVVIDSPSVAEAYTQEFHHIWAAP